ncbi:hypothetical protein SPRG_16907 [Saprolegnia parasitica CBS 223.65]|uniref:Uncharacterized protein n=1 Tax=Saprolegnia parasitica (strain CBS 223.65) TaxID=695850 RepID=A0A067BS30_SAPPC|nr:hypothetical protein SPRG_16907 [Saprolegnia parasitica CBS 223.65]KDO17482.1 hypothetical protein SPRG_16907 [Saprolegnia parasitica CBS 223.65]|eukprot:XP_012211808.1 hypothetical protein SPRG_16907 [Saprolegnia parasitica CBS 223.65]
MAFALFAPAETINYDFVAGMYGLFTLLALVLYVLQHYTDAVEGFYIVMAPFAPCLLWSLVVRRNWLRLEKPKTE